MAFTVRQHPFRSLYIIILAGILPLISNSLHAQQQTMAYGLITDSISGEPISFASVRFQHTTTGTATDIDGYFSISVPPKNRTLVVTSVGFSSQTITLPQDIAAGQLIHIRLSPTTTNLDEVIVNPVKKRYSRKNNPAVELMRQVISRKEQNNIKNKTDIQYEMYEKLTLYWDNFKTDNLLLRKHFNFITNHLDTSIFTGKQVLTLSMRETLANVRTIGNNSSSKDIIAHRSVGVEETFNDGSMDQFLKQVFQEINIYDDNIEVLLNKFVSPVSSLGILYYKFFIQDTITIDNIRCVNVSFTPFNSESFSFVGNLYIAIDHNYGIKRADLSIPRNLNINFLENLRIVQHFNLVESKIWLNDKEDIYANFAISDLLTKVYAHQVRSYHPGINNEVMTWETRRHLPLKRVEADLPALMNELQGVSLYRNFEKFLEIITTGYIKTSNERKAKSKIDIGPIWTLYGSNPIEGKRIRIGGMTTAYLHPHIFISGYGAYGFKDKKWKYSSTVGYSFTKKESYFASFPRNDLSFTAEYDLYSLGMQMDDNLKDNLFVALGTAGISNRSYQQRYKLAYTHERKSGLGFSAWWKHNRDTPAGALEYRLQISEDNSQIIPGFSLSKVGAEVTFSPGMDEYGANREGRDAKINFINDNIRLRLSHEYAYRGFTGGEWAYHQSQLNLSKRVWLSSFGHLDAQLSMGKIWNKVPFPMLASPPANPSLVIEKNRFHLLQPFEFVSDEYVSLHAGYFLKGWILNRIPLLNKLQLREVVTFSGYYGNLTGKNNPMESYGLFILPRSSHPMKGDLYMEGSVGIENIFKIFRVDYFRRFTHLDLPDAKKQGIKIGFRFAF